MSKFLKITAEVLAANQRLTKYLLQSSIKQGKKRGTFIGNYEIASEEFCKYGIILPKGGMIIPDTEPDELRTIVRKIHNTLVVESRKKQEEATAVQQEVENRAESLIAEARHRLLSKVESAYNLLKLMGRSGHLQALQYGCEPKLIKLPRDNFANSHRIGLIELPPITNSSIVFEWTNEDVDRLIQIIELWVKVTQPRRDFLWKLFVDANGVFTKKEQEKSFYMGKSLGRALLTVNTSHYSEGKWDEWVESTYWISGEKVDDLEYRWLKSRSNELEVPKGYVRVDNDTNDLLKIPLLPGQNDLLVIVGKVGSRRGVWEYGEWFRGHPSNCRISFPSTTHGKKKIKEVRLNGVNIDSKYVDLSLWTDYIELAKRALYESGIDASKEYILSLAEVYRQQDK